MDPKTEAEKLKRDREKLAHEKEIFALEKQKAALELEKQKQALIRGESKGLENEISPDDSFGYFAELTAYGAFLEAAHLLSGEVREKLKPGDRVLLTENKQQLQSFAGYKLLLLQLEDWLERMRRFLGEEEEERPKGVSPTPPEPTEEEVGRGLGVAPFSTAAAGVSGAISLAADVLKFFNYQATIHSRETNVQRFALLTKIVEQLSRAGNGDLQFYLEEHLRLSTEKKGGLLDLVYQSYQEAARLEQRCLEPDFPNREPATELLSGFRTFLLNLGTVPEGQAESPLARALMQEGLTERGITKVLYLEVASSGGEAIVRKGLLSFFLSGIKYLGGGVLAYTLADAEGSILAANTFLARASDRQKY